MAASDRAARPRGRFDGSSSSAVGGGRRVLVAGGAGFVGRSIVRTARLAGFEVHTTWRTTPPPDGITAHRLDLDDLAAAAALVERVRPDALVVSLGGEHRPSSPAQRLAVWRDAPVATSALLEACRHAPPHLVLLASSHDLAPTDGTHRETSPIAPVSWRGIAGHAAVLAVRQWQSETGAPATVLRPFSVYGPGEPPDRVIPTLLRCVASGSVFSATASDAQRDFVYVDDVAAAVVRAVTHRVVGEFNLGTGVGTSVRELVALVESVAGCRVEVRQSGFEPRPWDRPRWVADPAKAAAELGWRAQTTLADGVRGLLS